VVVGGDAYGSGSSREVAVVAHQGAGIELVVADSFQRIFQENMVYAGMPFTTDRGVVARLEAGEDVDLSQQMRARGMRIRFFPRPHLCHVDRASFRQFLQHQYNWGFHAPFIRGRQKNAAYSFLFPSKLWKARFCSPMIIMGYTMLVVYGWWRHRPFGLLSVLPLIVLGKIWYARGVLDGTKTLSSGLDGIIADRRG